MAKADNVTELSAANHRMTASVKEITPALARKYLSKMPVNRNINQDRVYEYSTIIKEGNWMQSGQSVVFDWDGNLLDGQHRLEGCIFAGKIITTVVVEGVDPRSILVIDTGQTRSASQILKMQGESYSNDLSAVTGFMHAFEQHQSKAKYKSRIPIWIRLDILDRHPDIRVSVKFMKSCFWVTRHSASTAVSCGIHYLASQKHGIEKAGEFMMLLNSGTNLDDDSPVFMLREFLSNLKASPVRMPAMDLWSAYRGSFYAWIEGRSLATVVRETSAQRSLTWDHY